MKIRNGHHQTENEIRVPAQLKFGMARKVNQRVWVLKLLNASSPAGVLYFLVSLTVAQRQYTADGVKLEMFQEILTR
jgi:hypothetical protein